MIKRYLTIDEVKKICRDVFKFKFDTKNRTNKFLAARYTFVLMCRKHCLHPTHMAIGAKIKRDHTTITNTLKKENSFFKLHDHFAKLRDKCDEICMLTRNYTIDQQIEEKNTAIKQLQKELEVLLMKKKYIQQKTNKNSNKSLVLK